jgi:hypothetical protein
MEKVISKEATPFGTVILFPEIPPRSIGIVKLFIQEKHTWKKGFNPGILSGLRIPTILSNGMEC